MVTAGRISDGDGGKRHLLARAEAALWIVRTEGRDRDAATADPLDRWLETDPGNAAAYAETLTVWDELGYILPDWRRDAPPPASAVKPRRRLVQAAVFACTILACVLGWSWLSSPSVYRTAIGEQRVVMLADGTKVTLNTDTELSFARPGKERRLVMRRGEALFNVAHDPSRPFIVEVAGRYVRALGTSFVVRKDQDRVDVVLLSGRVQVGAIAGGGDAVQLVPGQRYRQTGTGVPVLDRPALDVVTAWRDGELMLDNTPLRDAVAEMNRYRTKPIVLQGAGLGSLRLDGVFRTAESEGFARTVGMIYGLNVSDRSDGLVIAERTPGVSR